MRNCSLCALCFMRIVVDVMGGDHGCEVVIEGVKIALHACNKISGLCLVGDEAQIRAAMTEARLQDDRVEIVQPPKCSRWKTSRSTSCARKRTAPWLAPWNWSS